VCYQPQQADRASHRSQPTAAEEAPKSLMKCPFSAQLKVMAPFSTRSHLAISHSKLDEKLPTGNVTSDEQDLNRPAAEESLVG